MIDLNSDSIVYDLFFNKAIQMSYLSFNKDKDKTITLISNLGVSRTIAKLIYNLYSIKYNAVSGCPVPVNPSSMTRVRQIKRICEEDPDLEFIDTYKAHSSRVNIILRNTNKTKSWLI